MDGFVQGRIPTSQLSRCVGGLAAAFSPELDSRKFSGNVVSSDWATNLRRLLALFVAQVAVVLSGDTRIMSRETKLPPVDIVGARAKPGVYVGRVTIVSQRLGLARLKPDAAGFSILVPLWKFPTAGQLGARVQFTVANGGVIEMRLLDAI